MTIRAPETEDLVLVPLAGGRMLAVTPGEAHERILGFRLALTRARDRLECHRDPLVAEIDKVLSA